MANTSTATVSRVLSNKPGVSDAKRERILMLARKVGYSPNRLAQNLALQKSHVLGFIAAELTNPVYIDFFRRVQRKVVEMDYQVLIADSELSLEKEVYNIEVMRQHRAEGLIIFPVHDWRIHTNISHYLELSLQKFPFVVVGKLSGVNGDFVTTEEVETAYLLTHHLIDLGHRRIAFVGDDPENRCVRERLEGVRWALREVGETIHPENIIPYEDGWERQMIQMLKAPGRPTAIVFMNDVTGLIAYRPLMENGFKLPEDLSVVAFGHNIWNRHLKPALTTTHEQNDEVARVAIDLLLKRIEEPDRPTTQLQVSQAIHIRESTAPPPPLA